MQSCDLALCFPFVFFLFQGLWLRHRWAFRSHCLALCHHPPGATPAHSPCPPLPLCLGWPHPPNWDGAHWVPTPSSHLPTQPLLRPSLPSPTPCPSASSLPSCRCPAFHYTCGKSKHPSQVAWALLEAVASIPASSLPLLLRSDLAS